MTSLDRLRRIGHLTPDLSGLPVQLFSQQDFDPKPAWLTDSDLRLIVIDNVADYFWQTMVGESCGYIDMGVFPNIAPPLQTCFFDYHFTDLMHRKVFDYEGRGMDRIGVLMTSHDLISEAKAWLYQDADSGKDGAWTTVQVDEAKWILFFRWFECSRSITNAVWGPIGSLQSLVRADGTQVGPMHLSPPHYYTGSMETEVAPGFSLGDSLRIRSYFVLPALLAISFMHCKNTRLLSHLPPPKLSKKWEAKSGHPLCRYEILDILPVRAILEREGKISTTGLKKALHICRGHFKDYRAHGLFGKQKGLFWWDQHVRGTLDAGVVVKDYRVRRP